MTSIQYDSLYYYILYSVWCTIDGVTLGYWEKSDVNIVSPGFYRTLHHEKWQIVRSRSDRVKGQFAVSAIHAPLCLPIISIIQSYEVINSIPGPHYPTDLEVTGWKASFVISAVHAPLCLQFISIQSYEVINSIPCPYYLTNLEVTGSKTSLLSLQSMHH